MKRRTFLVLAMTSLAALTSRARGQATQPASDRHVLIVSIDGLRPDVLLRAKSPRIRGLMDAGSFTMWAQTTPASITLPSHASMLTGTPPEVHGVDWNSDLAEQRYARVPTIFEAAKAAGLTTAMAAGKSKFTTFAKPGSLDRSYVPEVGGHAIAGQKTGDEAVAQRAVEFLRDLRPNVLFMHLADVDTAGHTKGWGSPEQVAAVERADAAVGTVLDAIAEAGLADSTLVIISAHHGGAGLTHGPNDARSRHIPWIVMGPGIRKGYDLTQRSERAVRTEDTYAMACRHLRLPIPNVAGKPVLEALIP